MTPLVDENDNTWRRIKAWAEKRIDDCRGRNDNPQLGTWETAYLRGQIAQLKELLGLAGKLPPQEEGIDDA